MSRTPSGRSCPDPDARSAAPGRPTAAHPGRPGGSCGHGKRADPRPQLVRAERLTDQRPGGQPERPLGRHPGRIELALGVDVRLAAAAGGGELQQPQIGQGWQVPGRCHQPQPFDRTLPGGQRIRLDQGDGAPTERHHIAEQIASSALRIRIVRLSADQHGVGAPDPCIAFTADFTVVALTCGCRTYWRVSIDVCSARRACSRASSVVSGRGLVLVGTAMLLPGWPRRMDATHDSGVLLSDLGGRSGISGRTARAA